MLEKVLTFGWLRVTLQGASIGEREALMETDKALAAGYVLGDLTPDEEAQVQTFLEQRVDFIADVSAMQVVFNTLPISLPKATPPIALRDRILEAYTNKMPLPDLP